MPGEVNKNAKFTTGTASVEVLPANPRRTSWTLTNRGAGTQTIALGPGPAVADEGQPLQPNQTAGEQNTENFDCWKGSIQVVDTVAGTVSVSERTRTD